MTSERWRQVEAVLQEALDLPSQNRASFLNQACLDDEELKREATTLISAYDMAGDFIEDSAISQNAEVLLNDLPDLNIGRRIGSYRLLERLGSGGMGEVYLAEDTRLSRLVALKILPAFFVSDGARLLRFQAEARAVSALNHPNVLTIHEVGRESDEGRDTHFIATEFIDGQTIRELINQQTLTLEQILDISMQVGSGLLGAHAAGVIHRDVKPENVMRRRDGLVKVLDFGIAKTIEQSVNENVEQQRAHTEAGIVLGTVGYMSPEQARGLKVDERTDIWSFGVVLYEMLSGRGPFHGATRMDTLVCILEHNAEPLFTSNSPLLDRLQEIVNRSLEKDVDQRYATVSEMLADLKSVGNELTLAAAVTAEAERPFVQSITTQTGQVAKSRHRVRGWQPLAVVAIALFLTAVIATFYLKRAAKDGATVSSANSKLYKDMSETERLEFVAEQEQRISAMMGDRAVKLNDEAVAVIKAKVDRYVARTEINSQATGGDSLNEIYQRAVPFIPLIARSFEARKVPVTIGIYLPMIESAYRTCFESPLGAKGLFQFMPQTARNYGVSPEEMCNAEKMTPAAAHYIADRMAELGEDAQSMTLVLLSYNRGEGWVRDTLRELRGTPNYERNFWYLFANRDKLDESFRSESAGYVPLFFAAAIIGENPKTFELTTPPLSSLSGRPVPPAT